MNSLVDRLGELAEWENFVYYLIIVVIIVVVFMRLGGTYRLGKDFKIIIWGRGKPQRFGTIFYWGSWPLETPYKDFHLAIGGGPGWTKWLKKMGQRKILYFIKLFLHYILLVKILLCKLKNLYIQYAWISIMKKHNSNQNVKVEKMVVFVKTWLLSSQVWFW